MPTGQSTSLSHKMRIIVSSHPHPRYTRYTGRYTPPCRLPPSFHIPPSALLLAGWVTAACPSPAQASSPFLGGESSVAHAHWAGTEISIPWYQVSLQVQTPGCVPHSQEAPSCQRARLPQFQPLAPKGRGWDERKGVGRRG